MSRYGLHSRRMLSFLNEKPGSKASEISEHLFDGRTIEQALVQYRYSSEEVSSHLRTIWQSKQYVLDYMVSSEWYKDVKIIDERTQLVSKVCRGKFAYLTSPYNSRTLAADHQGSRPHPRAANRNAQRCWFYRTKGSDGIYRYFLTLKGMSELNEHGLK